MSPLKRRQRADAKQKAGRGKHASPGGPVYPLMRTPVAQMLLNPHAPSAEVPPELADRDYPLPRVKVPESRPLVSTGELMAALDADESTPLGDYDPQLAERVFTRMVSALDDTQPIPLPGEHGPEPVQPISLPMVGMVVDDTPQPAQHVGLTPVPVPSLPFLNAGAPGQPEPDEQPTQVTVHVGNALPARLTDVELAIHGLPIPADAPTAPSLPAPLRRDARHPFRFDTFDAEFWETVNDTARQQQAGPGGLRMSVDAAFDALDAHLAAADAAHRAQVERGTGMEYGAWLASQLADATRPLPHRVPGAALAEIEATRGQLVAS